MTSRASCLSMVINGDSLLLALHLLAAAAWFGSGWYDKLMIAPVRRGSDGFAVVKRFVARGGGAKWFGPASITTIASGAVLYWRLGIDWRSTSGAMVTLGAVLGIVALLLGILVHAPTEKALKGAVERQDDQAAIEIAARLDHHTSVSGYLVTAAFLLMALRHAF